MVRIVPVACPDTLGLTVGVVGGNAEVRTRHSQAAIVSVCIATGHSPLGLTASVADWLVQW